MQIKGFKWMAFTFLSLAAISSCGKNGQNSVSQASALNNVDAFAMQSGRKIDCDGEGKDFTGVYMFKFTNGVLNCPNAKQVELNASAPIYQCAQDEKTFTCVNQASVKDTMTGCINKDGQFKLSFAPKPQAAETTTEIESVTPSVVGFAVGKIGEAGGKVQYALPPQPGQMMRANCVSNSTLEVARAN